VYHPPSRALGLLIGYWDHAHFLRWLSRQSDGDELVELASEIVEVSEFRAVNWDYWDHLAGNDLPTFAQASDPFDSEPIWSNEDRVDPEFDDLISGCRKLGLALDSLMEWLEPRISPHCEREAAGTQAAVELIHAGSVTFRAIRLLVENRFPADAFGRLRALLEVTCTTALLACAPNPSETAIRYLVFGNAGVRSCRKEVVSWAIPESRFTPYEWLRTAHPDVRRISQRWVFKNANLRTAAFERWMRALHEHVHLAPRIATDPRALYSAETLSETALILAVAMMEELVSHALLLHSRTNLQIGDGSFIHEQEFECNASEFAKAHATATAFRKSVRALYLIDREDVRETLGPRSCCPLIDIGFESGRFGLHNRPNCR
jgi:hypothetical protein